MSYPIYLMGCKCPAEFDSQLLVVVKSHRKNCLKNQHDSQDSFPNHLTNGEKITLTVNGKDVKANDPLTISVSINIA